ncbi:hypothetical protein CRENBAI_015638, partial [Crenichthys baileyi]
CLLRVLLSDATTLSKFLPGNLSIPQPLLSISLDRILHTCLSNLQHLTPPWVSSLSQKNPPALHKLTKGFLIFPSPPKFKISHTLHRSLPPTSTSNPASPPSQTPSWNRKLKSITTITYLSWLPGRKAHL